MKLLRIFRYPSSIGKKTSRVPFDNASPELLQMLADCRKMAKEMKWERSAKTFFAPQYHFVEGIEEENKQVFEVEKDGEVFCIGFYDWEISTGTEPYHHDNPNEFFFPVPAEEFEERKQAYIRSNSFARL